MYFVTKTDEEMHGLSLVTLLENELENKGNNIVGPLFCLYCTSADNDVIDRQKGWRR